MIIKSVWNMFVKTLKFFNEHFKGLLFLLILFIIFSPSSKEIERHPNLEKIVLAGTIMDPSEVLQKIEDAKDDPYIKGVLFVINSPGGAVAPSVEIALAIKQLANEKPVVVYASGMLASGGYYSSIWADKIVANPGSMVGSIGVIMEGANLSELMDKIGIKTQVIKAGKYKQVGTPDREWYGYEKKELEKVIQGTYTMFVEDVAKARGLKVEQKDIWADAHIFTAAQAKEVGLVDQLGIESDAKEVVQKLANVKDPIWNKEDKFEKLMKKLSAQTAVILQSYFPPLVLR